MSSPRVSDGEYGALVTFIGRVRGYSEGKRVLYLEHDASGQAAEKMLKTIAAEIKGK